jgi:hypothetical protein
MQAQGFAEQLSSRRNLAVSSPPQGFAEPLSSRRNLVVSSSPQGAAHLSEVEAISWLLPLDVLMNIS